MPGTYTVTLVASNANCSDTTVFEAIADNAGIHEMQAINWMLYPNPARNEIFIKCEGEQPSGYVIWDASGRKIKSGSLTSMNSVINLEELSRGIYQFEVSFAHQKGSRKSFVKMD
jgi:PKD repeat protein